MCNEQQIKDVNNGKSVVVKKKAMWGVGFLIITGIIGWLITVIFWVAGTDTAIAQNTNSIKSNENKIVRIENWKIEHTSNQDELIYNMKRLLEVNGLEWKIFKK